MTTHFGEEVWEIGRSDFAGGSEYSPVYNR